MPKLMIPQVVCALLIVGPALPCLGQDQVIDLKEFSVSIPKSWERVADDKSLFTAKGPARGAADKYAENIRIEVFELPRSATPDQIKAAQTTAKALGRFKLIGEGRIDGTKTPLVWFAVMPAMPKSSSDELAKIDYVAVVGTKAYVMHCMVEANQWKEEQKAFDKIAQSLSFK